MRLTADEREQLEATLAPYEGDSEVRRMASFVQHGSVDTLSHCRSVAEVSWWLAHRLHANVDRTSLLVGALLHDFYLYDWHGAGWRHSYRHAECARRNAAQRFDVDRHTQQVIRCHMWPISITHVPSTREALLVCIADKYVSLHETLFQRHRRRTVCH